MGVKCKKFAMKGRLFILLAAICDDEEMFRKELKDFLLQYKKDRRIHLDIVEFSDGQSLLNYNSGIDIVFLDYEMPGLDGIETAKMLRAKKNLCCIMYITSYPEHVFESFEVNTYRYFIKPINRDKLTVAMDDFIKDKKMLAPIVVNVDGEQITISSEDVIYLEAEGKYCYVRTINNTVRSSKTIARVFELLPQHCFYRTHKSFAVNLYCVQSIKNNCVILNNGEKAKISRNNVADFKKAYREFVKHFIARV